MFSEISSVIRLNPIRLEQSIDEALHREALHVLSAQSDHEAGFLEAPSTLSHSDAPFIPQFKLSAPRPSGKKAADKLRRQVNRALRREQYTTIPRHSNSKKFTNLSSITVDYDAADLPAAKGGFVSQRQRCKTNHEWSLQELVDRGFKVVEWDGRTPTAIVDKQDRVMTILAGRPIDQDWNDIHARMSALLEEAGSKTQSPCKERRGNFVSLSTGISYGGGQTAPANLGHKMTEKATIDGMRSDLSFIRAAGFMSSCFSFYAPKLYKEYEDTLKALMEKHGHLRKPFNNSVFPTCTFNCGSRVVTFEHVDATNVPYGLCAIFALGSYNPILGGHLILFNLGLVVQFPPGSTILVPSGTIRHGNVAIQPNETRQSFTQYCPGGLLRWVAYGFQPVKSVSADIRRHFEDTHEERCRRAANLFSKVGEVYEDRVRTFGLRSHH